MATRVVRESHDEGRRQFWFLIALNIAAAFAFGGMVYVFDAMVS